MPDTILIVEDDEKLAALVAEFLGKEGFAVETVHRGDEAVPRILNDGPDLVILDLMLPGMDGFEVCKQVREQFAGFILMLTARNEDVDEILGLELGADDYVTKPVRPRVLVSRIRALLRRHPEAPATDPGEPIRIGTLRIDPANRTVTQGEHAVDLSSGEFDLLIYLARRPGQTITRDALYRDVRGIEYDGLDRSIDLRVARLRKKLGDDAKHPARIKSVRGEGYLLAPGG
ncbi:MAG: response regulator transcription factor [Akkermansiaceae bacterium]|nr:response regulator transcription factor [Akkermansiaceae bacterium]NNM29949.1 response regulator transcription factor [Akkermansiaceae bacterium]